MSVTSEVKCDGCGKVDINYTSNCEGWYLQLANVSKSPWYVKNGERGGAVTSMAVAPPIEHSLHFCGVPCLAKWMADNEPKAIEQYDKMMKHRTWLEEQTAKRTASSSS